MAHFTYTRSGGSWSTIPVSYAEMADLDAKTFKAVNGDDGGTWAPASAIVIGGAGLTVAGQFSADGAAVFSGDVSLLNGVAIFGPITVDTDVTAFFGGPVTCGQSLTVNGAAQFNSPAVFANDATFQGGLAAFGPITVDTDVTAFFGGPVTCSQTLTVNGAATFTAGLNSGGDIIAAAGISVGTTLNVGGVTTLNAPLVWAGNGRPLARQYFGPDSNANISIANGNTIIPVTSTSRTYTWLDTGAQDTDWFEIGAGSVVNSLLLSMPAGTVPGVFFNISSISGQYGYAKFVRFGGVWRLMGMAINP